MRASSIALLGAAVPALAGHIDLSVDCPFTIDATGSVSGPIGQIEDGQLNINGAGSATFVLDGGVLRDSQGRGCIITWPQRQLQCDYGNPGQGGFDITSDGKLRYGGSSDWWACPINDYGIWNVYTDPLPGQLKCTMIDVVTDITCHSDSSSDSDSDSDSDSEGEKGHSENGNEYWRTHIHTPYSAPPGSPCHQCGNQYDCLQICFLSQWNKHHGHFPPTPIPVPTSISQPCSCSECKPGDLACWGSCFTTTVLPPPTPTATSCVETKTWDTWAPTWAPTWTPTQPAQPTPTWGCNDCHEHRCDSTCWNTVTSTTTTMTTVTAYTPIPCRNCLPPNDCTSTCTVISTATSTATVWSPCVDRCQGDWSCINQCSQPTPVCASGRCGNWLDYKGGSEEEWEYPPRPWNYDGYWPNPAPDHMHPQNYYGYWQHQKRDVEVEMAKREIEEVSKEIEKRGYEASPKTSEAESPIILDENIDLDPSEEDEIKPEISYSSKDPVTWLKIKTIMASVYGICRLDASYATEIAYQTLQKLDWIDGQEYSENNPPPFDDETLPMLGSEDFASQVAPETPDFNERSSVAESEGPPNPPREKAISNLIERAMSSENEFGYGESSYDVLGNNREFAILQNAREQRQPYHKNNKEFVYLRNKYSKCCSRCDFDDDPTPCFNECAYNECSSTCKSRNCMKRCRAALPTPCVPGDRCGEFEFENVGRECKTCGYGKYPEYDYFVIV